MVSLPCRVTSPCKLTQKFNKEGQTCPGTTRRLEMQSIAVIYSMSLYVKQVVCTMYVVGTTIQFRIPIMSSIHLS